VTDLTSEQVVERCRTYWLSSGVDRDLVSDMALELRSHIQEATSAGKTIDSVVGGDLEAFAEDWASAYGASTTPPAATPPSPPHTGANTATVGLWLGALAIVAIVTAVAFLAPNDSAMEKGTWATVWLVAAALLAVGELLTAGFFLLPFAVGASAAGLLALAEVAVATQIIMFVVVSIAFLWLLQRFAIKDIRGELQPVGAARYIGSHAVVTTAVDRLSGTGRVKMGTEDWRATTDGDMEIPPGAEVRVLEVRGARLVVEVVNK
jgi:membrane protein implicated in regulation of membrane protease activity